MHAVGVVLLELNNTNWCIVQSASARPPSPAPEPALNAVKKHRDGADMVETTDMKGHHVYAV